MSIIVSATIIYLPNIINKNDNNNDDNIGLASTSDEQTAPIQETDVTISSIPSKASVYINNVFEGKTPIIVSLPEGNYDLKINLTGYKGIKTDFNITSDMARQDINVTFEPIN